MGHCTSLAKTRGVNMKRRITRPIWKAFGTAYFVFFLCMYLTEPVYAYIDPATTAMLTQIIAGVFISIGVVFGVFRRKIIFFFKNLNVNRVRRKIERQSMKDAKK